MSLLRVDILSDSESILSNSSPLHELKSQITFTTTPITGINVAMAKFVKSENGFVLLHEGDQHLAKELLKLTRGKSKVLIASESIGFSSSQTQHALDRGAILVNCYLKVIAKFLKQFVELLQRNATKDQIHYCGVCNAKNMNETEVRHHLPAFHGNLPMEMSFPCSYCSGKSFANITRHVYEDHFEKELKQIEARPGYSFSVCIVQHQVTKKFLLVQEFACEGWWVPAGRLDKGESFKEAAIREAKEESGMDVELLGVLAVEFNPDGCKHRNIFLAQPKDPNQLPKQIPDYESQEARWFSLFEIQQLEVRSSYELRYINLVASGKFNLYSLDLLVEK